MSESGNSQNNKINNFEIALRMRDFEINQLTQRNNFFMIFQGVLFAGLVQSDHIKPIVSFMVCIVGLIVAIYQVKMASGAKFWQEYWEQMLSEYETIARESRKPELFHADNDMYIKTVRDRMDSRKLTGLANMLVMRRYSVSRIPIYVGIALSIIWGVLILFTLREPPPFSLSKIIVGF